MPVRSRGFFPVFCVAFLGPLAGAIPAEPPSLPKEGWYAVYLQDEKVGYSHTLCKQLPGKEAVLSSTDVGLSVKRLGQSVTMRMKMAYEESLSGKILGFSMSTKSSLVPMEVRGTVQGDKLHLSVGKEGKVQVRPWDDSVIGPYASDRLLAAETLRPGLTVRFDTFSLEALRKTTVQVHVKEQEDVDVMGKQLRLWRTEITQDVMPGIVVVSWIDDQGELFKSRARIMGMAMDHVKCAKEQALSESEQPDLFADKAVVRVKRRVRRPRGVRQVMYRIRLDNPEALKADIEDDRQKIVRREGKSIDLYVHDPGPPAETSAEVPPGFENYLKATTLLESDDGGIRKVAESVAGKEKDRYRKAKRLERWVFNAIREKSLSVGFAGAKETLRTREGDCTEHAVLLAALLRASKIPSKVAYGLVYVDEPATGGPIFGAHMWTEAWVGRWVALDATLARPFVDALHVKLGESALDTPALGTEFLNLLHFLGQMSVDILNVSYDESVQTPETNPIPVHP